MTSYIPHRILVIRDTSEESLLKCYSLAFDWANKMGLEGKRVFDMSLKIPTVSEDPLNIQQYYLLCRIECTVEERIEWESLQEQKVIDSVFNLLND